MRATPVSLLIALVTVFSGCEDERGLNERRAIRGDDMPMIRELVRQDLERVDAGVREAADRMARGFLVEDPAQRERELRLVLRRLQQPPRAITGLMLTPITFVAAVGLDGKVIARDAQDDQMRGFDIARAAPVVRRALNGEGGRELSRLPSLEEGGLPSVTIVFAAPARHEGRVVGAIVAGLPLWRIGQQATRQLQLENADARAQGHLMWVMLYDEEGEQHYHAGFPPDLRALAPSAADRAAALRESPGGYTGELQQFGRWYGYGVLPTPSIAEGTGVILFRSDPY